jgi:hypothetical protein
MSTQKDREEILKYGDLLERHMYADNDFASAFSLYPVIWAAHILPRRSKGTLCLESKDWQRFAEFHYTAIVRCWNALQTVRRIVSSAEKRQDETDAARAQMNWHDGLACFLWFSGSAKENLQRAFASDPIKCETAFEGVASHGTQRR